MSLSKDYIPIETISVPTSEKNVTTNQATADSYWNLTDDGQESAYGSRTILLQHMIFLHILFVYQLMHVTNIVLLILNDVSV